MIELKSTSYSNETFERLNHIAKNFILLFNHPKAFLNGQDYSIFKVKNSFYKLTASTPTTQSNSDNFGITIFPNIQLDSKLKIMERPKQMAYYISGFKNKAEYHVDDLGKQAKGQEAYADFYFRETIETTGGFGLLRELESILFKIENSLS